MLNAPIVGGIFPLPFSFCLFTLTNSHHTDTKYGKTETSEIEKYLHGAKPQHVPLYLHARRLRFKHPGMC